MTKQSAIRALAVVAALASAWFAAGAAQADWAVNMPQGVTPLSGEIFDLHMWILWICVVIGIGVFGAMFWSMFHHRKSRGVEPAQFHESTTVEVIWTLVPFLILLVMGALATRTLIAMEDTRGADMTVKVTGYQWKWHYDHVDEGVAYFSNLATGWDEINNEAEKGEHYLLDVDNPLVVPVGQKVRLLVTAADVIHSWWVPELYVKKDAIPGFINETWFQVDKPGTYRGQCTELCGKDHGFMPVVVVAKSEADYATWLAEQKSAKEAELLAAGADWAFPDLMAKGEEVYNTNCAACHQANGQGMAPVFPAIAGSAVATGPLEAHLAVVMNGVSGTAMQGFGAQLSDLDLAAVITYQRNAWGNDTGDTIQASAIKAAR